MNRLSVRVSIVGAVLTLSAAGIALRMLPDGESSSPEGDAAAQQAAQADPVKPATPIRTDEQADQEVVRAIEPPPPSAFTGFQPMRTVSHEDATDEKASEVPTADPIPALGAGTNRDAAYSAYAPPSPFPAERADNSPDENVQLANPPGAADADPSTAYDAPLPTPTNDSSIPETPQYETTPGGSDGFAARSPAPVTDPPASPAGSPAPPAASSFPLADSAQPARPASRAATNDASTGETTGAALGPGPGMSRAAADTYPSTDGGLGTPGSPMRRAGSDPASTDGNSDRLLTDAAAESRASIRTSDFGATGEAGLSSNVPGDRALEGQQSPAIVLEKTAPDEIQVERKATFQIRVRNVGNSAAHNVVVIDQVPRGTEFVDAVPECTPTADGLLVWNLKTLQASEEVILAVNLLPKAAGEIGSVAQVTFQAQAAVRTICTQPQLSVELTIPEQVLIGTSAPFEIVVTNKGSGAATNVIIEEDVPEGFTHAAGRQLEHEIGTLLPQESRRLSLVLDAAKPGLYENRLIVRGDGNLREEDVRKIEVAAPRLEVSMQGPALRYLDRQATYVVRMANPGTAPARNVELVTHLPKGMKYVTSDNQGQYDSQSHAVYWSLEELPATKQGDVHLTVLPIEPGNHKLKADGHADLGLQHTCEHEVVVEGLAELSFSVADAADPIEVGSETIYEVRVHNRGSKADSDIRVMAELPPGMVPASGDGPVPATVQGQRVVFNSLARLAPDEEAVFKIHATGQATGDHVVRVQLQSAEVRVPVTKEEMTRVYADQ